MRDHVKGTVGSSRRRASDQPARPVLRFYDTLTRSKVAADARRTGPITIYTCGPTVYRDAHLGNLRSYLMADWLRRLLIAQGYTVRQVKNITDVGHMREDLLDRGEDKVIAAARAAGRTPQEIAEHYTRAFLEDERRLNILPAHEFPRASACVAEMVEMTQKLVEMGRAYEAGGNVYFDVSSFPEYGKLSGQRGENLEESGRAAADPLKRDQRDFALWKAAEPGRTLKWPSPWGEGFPGWHIECSAIARKHLGDEIDFHTGGVDNIFPHHEDEIAQSESIVGRPHVRTWMHGQHLLVDGLKMAKSTGNVYLVADLEARGYDPLAFRYLCAMAGYRSRLNFTQTSMRAAAKGLERLRSSLHGPGTRVTKKARAEGEALRLAFWEAAADGLNVPAAVAVAWKVARSRLPIPVKRELLMDFDRLLGLNLLKTSRPEALEPAISKKARERDRARRSGDYARADAIREEIGAAGYRVQDHRAGPVITRIPAWENAEPSISSSLDVDSLLETEPELEFTVSIVARRGCDELERCVSSVRGWLRGRGEVVVVDNGFEESCEGLMGTIVAGDAQTRLIRADHFLGSAAGRNAAMRQARGRYLVSLDTSVELTGDIFGRLKALLDDETVGVAGKWGVVTSDLRQFTESPESGDVHAVEGYLMAMRRDVLREAGLLDERFRFYRHLDLDLSFAIRSRGYRAVIDADLPAVRHEHVEWEATPVEERDRLSKRNFYRFLHKWGERTDLIGRTG